jgi:UDP-N-acetylmuramoyl-L-alanyl-D-glutamate--2,6-diaminopimelate ligase
LIQEKLKKMMFFVAIRGSVSDGHDYIQKAIELGASNCL